MSDDTKLQIILEAVNDTASPFQDLNASIESFQKSASELARSLSESFQSMNRSASESATGIESSMKVEQGAFKGMAESAATSFQSSSNEMNNLRNNVTRGIGEIGGLIAIQQLGQSMEELGKKGEHLFHFAVEQGTDFQQTMKNVQTVIATNITAHESWNDKLRDASGLTSQLQEKALELGSRGAQSANEVGSAMDTMLRAGVDAQAVLNGAAESAQNVAIVTGDKLDESANLVTEIYHQFRESFAENGKSMQDNMKTTGDVLTGTLLSARINSQDFLDTLKYVGPVASQLGSTFLDTATATAVLAQNGIKGSQAGNNLKRALTSLLEPTKHGAEAMQNLGLIQHGHNMLIDESTGKMKNLTDIQKILHQSMEGLTEVKKAQYIHDMFGQYALAGTLVLANENSEAFSTLKEKIGGISAENASVSMLDTFSGHMAQLKAHVETTAKEFGMAFIPVLEKLVPIGQKILNWFQELTPANKEFLMILLGVGSAVAIAGGALATFAISAKFAGEGLRALKSLFMIQAEGEAAISVFKALALSVREVGIAEAFMNLMNPLGWIALAVAAVIGLAMVIMQNWGPIKAFLENLWTGIKNTAITVWDGIKSFFQKWGLDILAVLLGPVGILAKLIYDHWDQIKSFTVNLWNDIVNGIRNLWTGFTNWISNAVQTTMQAIVGAFDWMYNHNYYFKNLVDFIRKSWETIKEDAAMIWNGIKQFFSNLWDGIKNVAKEFWENEKRDFEIRWNAIVDVAKEIWYPIANFFSDLWDGISNSTSSIWDGIKTTMSSLWNATVDDAKQIFSSLGNFFTGLWNDALNWGANIVHMIADGIKNAAQEVWDAAKNVAGNIAHWLGFHSPSAGLPDSGQWAPNFMNMFAKGMTDGIPGITNAATQAGDAIKNGITKGANAAVEGVKSAMNQTLQMIASIQASQNAGQGSGGLSRVTQDSLNYMRWSGAASGTGNESLVNSAEGRSGIQAFIDDQYKRLYDAAKASHSTEDIGELMDKAKANADALLSGNMPLYGNGNMPPVTSGGSKGTTIINNIYASNNVTESNHKLGEIVSEALLGKMKLQGKLG